jgi:hypothetical protein
MVILSDILAVVSSPEFLRIGCGSSSIWALAAYLVGISESSLLAGIPVRIYRPFS